MKINVKPMKKVGIEIPINDRTCHERSNTPFFLTAEIIPTGIAIRNDKEIDATLIMILFIKGA